MSLYALDQPNCLLGQVGAIDRSTAQFGFVQSLQGQVARL